jgi:hypothetical protein
MTAVKHQGFTHTRGIAGENLPKKLKIAPALKNAAATAA